MASWGSELKSHLYEGIEKYRLVVTNSNGIVKYSIRNVVNSIVIIMRGARWVLDISGETPCKVCDYVITMLYTWN